jgi:hypothetical protein
MVKLSHVSATVLFATSAILTFIWVALMVVSLVVTKARP